MSLIRLAGKGSALVVTDLHGDLKSFNRYMDIWDEFHGKNNHFILTGDFIHGLDSDTDGSVEILELLKYRISSTDNFHVLLGNHEWTHITGQHIYKGGHNQKIEFEELVRRKWGSRSVTKLAEYIGLFERLKIAVRTDNGVFISHAGPSNTINTIEQVMNITRDGYSNLNLDGMIWDRYGDYSLYDLDRFLNIVDCQVSLVGHTVVDGYSLIGDRQLILSSNNNDIFNRSAYLELDLEQEIRDIHGLVGMVRYLD